VDQAAEDFPNLIDWVIFGCLDDDIHTGIRRAVLWVGSILYAESQMVPKNRHLRETLGIPDAHERSELRKRDGIIGDDKMGFALVTTKRCGSLL
jgi:hypothetical protein